MIDSEPALTFTANGLVADAPLAAPTRAYMGTILAGLGEAYPDRPAAMLREYLFAAPGMDTSQSACQ